MLKTIACSLALLLMAGVALAADKGTEKKKGKVLDQTMKSLDGKPVDLKKYDGKVVLIVNVASQCGLTPQYSALQKLHEKYKDQGLAILGFPCNQFGKQEPGTSIEISEFCTENYGVTFDMFEKVVVNGDEQCPLYKFLTSETTNPGMSGKIAWNFEKFLIDREGNVVKRFPPRTKPESDMVVKSIEAELEKK